MPYGTGDEALERLAQQVIGAAIEVHRRLGPGLKEELYRRALCMELDALGIRYEREKRFEVRYREKLIGYGAMDLLVMGMLPLELKSVVGLSEFHKGQLVYYLKASRLKLGLLLNFGQEVMKAGIRRVVN